MTAPQLWAAWVGGPVDPDAVRPVAEHSLLGRRVTVHAIAQDGYEALLLSSYTGPHLRAVVLGDEHGAHVLHGAAS